MGEERQRRLPAAVACAGERAGRRGEGKGGQGRGGEAAEPVVAAASMEQLSEVLLQREGESEGQINVSLSLSLSSYVSSQIHTGV